jgi:hypothetical protein
MAAEGHVDESALNAQLTRGPDRVIPKEVKWVQAIWFVESFADLASGQGGLNEDYEYYGWRDPI